MNELASTTQRLHAKDARNLCKILPLSYRGCEIPGLITQKCRRRMQLNLARPVHIGAAVQVETDEFVWLGEISCTRTEGDGCAAWVEIEHVTPRHLQPKAAPLPTGGFDKDSVPLSLFFLKGMRLLAVKADPVEYRQFQAEMEALEEQFRTAGPEDIQGLAGLVLTLLHTHNQLATEYFLNRVEAAEADFAALTQATSKMPVEAAVEQPLISARPHQRAR